MSDSTNVVVDLLWYRDSKGYVLEDHGRWGKWVGRRGGEQIVIYPLRNDRAFKAFANVSDAAELVSFMKHYGYLDHPDSIGPSFFKFYEGGGGSGKRPKVPLKPIKHAPKPKGEDVDQHLRAAAVFREFLSSTPRRPSPDSAAWLEAVCEEPIGEVHMCFDRHGHLGPVLKPVSLMAGLLWQLLHSGGSNYRSCQQCGTMFQVGVGSGRREDAKFCSEEHRILFNSRKRSTRSMSK